MVYSYMRTYLFKAEYTFSTPVSQGNIIKSQINGQVDIHKGFRAIGSKKGVEKVSRQDHKEEFLNRIKGMVC